MTGKDSGWINDFFANRLRDLTPAAARHFTQLFYVPVSHDPEVTIGCASVLSESELQIADRFATQSDRALFKQRRAFRRYCGALALGSPPPLSQVDFKETEKGRPWLCDLPDSWFSFSSCRHGFIGAWSSTHAIGVDLEDQTKDLETTELAQQYFSTAEARAIERAGGSECRRIFLQFWSLKEAALKSIGEGLPFGLNAFEFELEPGLRFVHVPPGHGGAEQFSAHVIAATDSCAALVIRSLA